ncbi:unnamed protein product [Pylaiella littoralis]
MSDGFVSKIKRWTTARGTRSSSHRRLDCSATCGKSSWRTPGSTSSTMSWQSGSRKVHNMCLRTYRKCELLIETDFIEKYRYETRSCLDMLYRAHDDHDGGPRAPYCSPDGGKHTTDAWVFVPSDPNHDFDFHIYALDIILQPYIKGEGRAATAGTRVPTVHMYTDGCAKQYKGKRNFMTVAQSLHRLGVILLHNCHVTLQGRPR